MPAPKFPDLEAALLAKWDEEKVFAKTLTKTAAGEPFVFYDGPPTANGKPGIHHAIGRAFKDVIPRYQTMRGRFVDRKAGWDTHGLPVELQVEKSLGISGKQQIENIVAGDARASIVEFNKKCKESVWVYRDEWEKFSRRIAFWVDMEHPYVTYENNYIESLWSVLKNVHEKGLLYQGHKVVLHCPRCGTTLSSHEVAQGYKTTTDESVFIKFKVVGEDKTFLLGWTTTPWTLPGNVALAVGADINYARVAVGDEIFILAEGLVETVLADLNHQVLATFKGAELIGLKYEPLFDFLANEIKSEERAKTFQVYPADFVTTTDGTGIVHTAVMYGVDDYELGIKIGLPKLHTVGEDGKFLSFVKSWAGKFVKSTEVEQGIIADLQTRGRLLRSQKYEHEYPFCWRCSTPLLYYAKDSWFIRMTELSAAMVERNNTVHWVPDHIRDGRFGEWLKNIKDWAISRERYWGTPLPVWKCDVCGQYDVIGSTKELVAKGVTAVPEDLHRPYIDEVKYKCACGGTKQRIKEVADVWFDSGAMFVAQWGYLWGQDGEAKKQFTTHFPADYIAEAIDQTRGWFYTLIAVATLLDLPAPYRHVICYGHVLDAKGKKMSKSIGNVVDPWDIFNAHGSDALRIYMFTVNHPGEVKLFDAKDVGDVVKKVFLPLWNMVEFYKLYADKGEAKKISTDPLDIWITNRTNGLVASVTQHLDTYEITEAARELTDFITDLSTWYVRRSRDRFKVGGEVAAAATTTLRQTLLQLACLLAPFAPFIADAVYREVSGAEESVHLQDWPRIEKFDPAALDGMNKIRDLVSQALKLRTEAGIPVRQVLAQLAVPQDLQNLAELMPLVQDELNVEEVVFGEALLLDINITPELREKGLVREIIRHINSLRKERGLKPGEPTTFVVKASSAIQELIERQSATLQQATISKFTFGEVDKSAAKKIDFDAGEFCWLQ